MSARAGAQGTVDPMTDAKLERVFNYAFGDIYRNYVAKVERKERSREELDDVLGWFTGLSAAELDTAAQSDETLRDFFDRIDLAPTAELITGSVCGVKVHEVEDPLMRKIRQMDKIVDELARGKKVDNIKRDAPV